MREENLGMNGTAQVQNAACDAMTRFRICGPDAQCMLYGSMAAWHNRHSLWEFSINRVGTAIIIEMSRLHFLHHEACTLLNTRSCWRLDTVYDMMIDTRIML